MYNILTPPVESTTYLGWTNRETWNVSLWIQNSERLYQLSLTCNSYEEFKYKLGVPDINTFETPDGVDFDDPALNIAELDELFQVEDWGLNNNQKPAIRGLFYYLVATSTCVLPARATSTGVLLLQHC